MDTLQAMRHREDAALATRFQLVALAAEAEIREIWSLTDPAAVPSTCSEQCAEHFAEHHQGSQRGSQSAPSLWVNWTTSPPSRRMRWISSSPERSDTNANWLPSADPPRPQRRRVDRSDAQL